MALTGEVLEEEDVVFSEVVEVTDMIPVEEDRSEDVVSRPMATPEDTTITEGPGVDIMDHAEVIIQDQVTETKTTVEVVMMTDEGMTIHVIVAMLTLVEVLILMTWIGDVARIVIPAVEKTTVVIGMTLANQVIEVMMMVHLSHETVTAAVVMNPLLDPVREVQLYVTCRAKKALNLPKLMFVIILSRRFDVRLYANIHPCKLILECRKAIQSRRANTCIVNILHPLNLEAEVLLEICLLMSIHNQEAEAEEVRHHLRLDGCVICLQMNTFPPLEAEEELVRQESEMLTSVRVHLELQIRDHLHAKSIRPADLKNILTERSATPALRQEITTETVLQVDQVVAWNVFQQVLDRTVVHLNNPPNRCDTRKFEKTVTRHLHRTPEHPENRWFAE